jgi:hypothetical protein
MTQLKVLYKQSLKILGYMSTKKLFVKQHLGLGDNIVHNGMVRKISEDYPEYDIYVPAKSHNIDNIKFMYRDNHKIKVVETNNDNDMNRYILTNGFDKIISSYLIGQKTFDYSKDFDDAFYLMSGYNPKIKHEYFHIERDIDEENRVYQELILDNNIGDYIFIHEKKDENILIDRNRINSDLPIIYADKKYKTFSLLKVIENAKECHIISSSFLSLLMCYKLNSNVCAHMYSDRIELSDYIGKNNIKVIK